MTSHYCLLGRDVSHSPSPAVMTAAFKAVGIDADYARVSVPESGFAREFESLKASSFRGMNVTIPFKTEVIHLLDGLDSVATRIQAVNTVKLEDDGRYVGHNTDPDGVVGALRASSASPDLRNALLIGAGGAARAFCEAMNRIGCIDVAVAAREVTRARGFVLDMERAFPRMNLTLASIKDLRHLSHDLVFNASPMGAKDEPLPAELKRLLPGSKVVFDAVYRPRTTRLLSEAERDGAKVVRGEEMLLHQGMAAFTLWTGSEAPERQMRKALVEALGAGVKRKSGGRSRR